jgi:hypothetical protein
MLSEVPDLLVKTSLEFGIFLVMGNSLGFQIVSCLPKGDFTF